MSSHKEPKGKKKELAEILSSFQLCDMKMPYHERLLILLHQAPCTYEDRLYSHFNYPHLQSYKLCSSHAWEGDCVLFLNPEIKPQYNWTLQYPLLFDDQLNSEIGIHMKITLKPVYL